MSKTTNAMSLAGVKGGSVCAHIAMHVAKVRIRMIFNS